MLTARASRSGAPSQAKRKAALARIVRPAGTATGAASHRLRLLRSSYVRYRMAFEEVMKLHHAEKSNKLHCMVGEANRGIPVCVDCSHFRGRQGSQCRGHWVDPRKPQASFAMQLPTREQAPIGERPLSS